MFNCESWNMRKNEKDATEILLAITSGRFPRQLGPTANHLTNGAVEV
jgi:hypothetical protein